MGREAAGTIITSLQCNAGKHVSEGEGLMGSRGTMALVSGAENDSERESRPVGPIRLSAPVRAAGVRGVGTPASGEDS